MPLKNGRTTASLQTVLVGSVIPAGTIAPFGGGSVPTGWLLCDGSTASRTTYPNLFAAVGTLHGQGDGSTTFHLPDYRGRFLRGADDMGTGAAGRDPNAGTRIEPNTGGATGSGVGSVQGGTNQSHTHGMNNAFGMHSHTGSGDYAMRQKSTSAWTPNLQQGADSVGLAGTQTIGMQLGGTTDAPAILSVDGTETRPQNANVEYIIKV